MRMSKFAGGSAAQDFISGQISSSATEDMVSFDYETWATAVRQQMLASIQRRNSQVQARGSKAAYKKVK